MSLHFNKDLKMEYSWLPKGITSSFINQIHYESKSIISAFWSDGEYICEIIDSTVNSIIFGSFLWILKYFLKMRNLYDNDKSVVILDNASYHTSKQKIRIFKYLCLNVQILPPYSPTLDPVEVFFKTYLE